MKAHLQHAWDLTPREARDLQEELRGRAERRDRLGPIRRVAGIDIGFEDGGAVTRAAVVVLGFPDLAPREQALAREPTRFPYVPGLLSFREIPAALQALRRLRRPPDLIVCDGHGYAHPRRFGLACHLGVLLDLPSIGAAKTRLIGTHGEVPDERGAWTPLYEGGEVIGAALRTRPGVKPIYISIGHRVSLETAVRYAMACTQRYRLPETTRAAHRLASG